MGGHEAFTSYWQQAQAEAEHTEDISKLDQWVKQIDWDREKLQALRDRQREASGAMGAEAQSVVALISRILMLLDEISAELRRRLHMLRDQMGMWVFLAGMGAKSKPKPKDQGAPKKDEKTKKTAKKEALAKPKAVKPQKKISR